MGADQRRTQSSALFRMEVHALRLWDGVSVMRFFSAAYPILADDITALGPHQYLTSTRFQTTIWEGLLADSVLGEKPGARDEFESVALLFQEGYNRALAPVSGGEK